MNRYVYHVIDRWKTIRYVGLSRNPYFRMLEHHLEARKILEFFDGDYGNPFYRWLAEELKSGRCPNVVPIRTGGYKTERDEILLQLCQGSPLLNRQGYGLTWSRRDRKKFVSNAALIRCF